MTITDEFYMVSTRTRGRVVARRLKKLQEGGVILVAKNKERFQVTTGNIVETSHVDEIAMFLGKLNNMDSDTLDDLYKKQMREGIMSPKGGAGLGFVDIRRKTGNPLDYSFVKIDHETSFFIFTSTITR